MKAIGVFPSSEGSQKSQLKLFDAPDPACGPRDILVSVSFAGLNFADLGRKASHYGHDKALADIPIAGLEMSGVVAQIGSEVTKFSVGDRVMAMAPRAYAQQVSIDERLAIHVPDELDLAVAAAVPVAYMTAHDALVTNGYLKSGMFVLIQAASSSMGIASVQLAKFLGAKCVIGTSRSSDKLRKLRDHGLDIGVVGTSEDVVEQIKQATNGEGPELIIDCIGSGVLQQNVDCARIAGTIVQVGRLGGHHDSLNLDEFARKRLKLVGVTFRTKSLVEHAEVVSKLEAEILESLANGKLSPIIDRVFSFSAAEEAQDYMKSNAHMGKVLLNVDG